MGKTPKPETAFLNKVLNPLGFKVYENWQKKERGLHFESWHVQVIYTNIVDYLRDILRDDPAASIEESLESCSVFDGRVDTFKALFALKHEIKKHYQKDLAISDTRIDF